ncbi:hypothetical protein C0J45_16100 [Silurus meridionalis]|nr:hypothetical protein C0J45_16100 [Silurus meridionalis]
MDQEFLLKLASSSEEDNTVEESSDSDNSDLLVAGKPEPNLPRCQKVQVIGSKADAKGAGEKSCAELNREADSGSRFRESIQGADSGSRFREPIQGADVRGG